MIDYGLSLPYIKKNKIMVLLVLAITQKIISILLELL